MVPTPVDSLTMLLAAQSFLLAAVSVALAMQSPDRAFVSKIRMPPLLTAAIAVIVTLATMSGAVASWLKIYNAPGGHWHGGTEVIVAVAILAASVGQGFLTLFMAIAMVPD